MEGVNIDYSEKTPELRGGVDKARAAEIGITAEEISQTLEVRLRGKVKQLLSSAEKNMMCTAWG